MISEKHRRALRRSIKKAQRVAHSLPPSKKQIEALNRGRKIARFSHRTLYRGDIVNTKNWRIIEIDGEYWHKKHKKHDQFRDKVLANLGWKILHLPAKEKYLFTEKTVYKALHFISWVPKRFPRLLVA